jgi:hypothetical protein
MKMNLAEFIRKNDIKCTDGAEFDHSPEFYKMKQFENTCHRISGVPFLEPETYEIREFDITLTGSIQEKWDKTEKKTRRRFFIDRSFTYPEKTDEYETIEDSFPAGKTIDEAITTLDAEKERFEFFKQFDLIDTGRYWLNRDLKRCLVMDGQVIVVDD